MFTDANTLQILDLTKNQIDVVEMNAFAGLENSLTILTLSSNRLEYLKRCYFSGLDKLNTLYINDNLISFIEVGTFSDLINLVDLDLSKNALFHIPPGVLSDLPSLVYLTLSQNCLKSINNFNNLPSLYSLELSSNNIAYINFSSLNNNSPILEKVLISDNIFESRFLYVSGLTIKELDLSLTNLEGIKIERTMPKLSSLNISNNPFLKSLVGLENTGLRNFYLKNVSLSLFKSIDLSRLISQLTKLDLSDNKLDQTNITLNDKIKIDFLFLSNTHSTKSIMNILNNSIILDTLDLSNNQLPYVLTHEIGKHFIRLHLANNEIRELDELISSESLSYLDLSFNQLKLIKKKWFEGFPGLVGIYLSNNMIEFIEHDSFFMFYLNVVDFQNNRLKYFSHVYFDQYLARQFRINSVLIYNNNISLLDMNGFELLTNLDASKNSLTNERIYNLRYCSSHTQVISLSNNNLTHIDQTILFKTVLLEKLNFSHNQIAYVDENSFSSLILLGSLDLSHNQIAHLPNNVFDGLTFLTYLDLSHNQLMTINMQVFRKLVSLEYLGLSFNQIKLIEDFSFQDLGLLFTLTLDLNSQVLTFSKETFTGLESISFLKISPEYFNSRENLIALKESLLSNSGIYVGSKSYYSELQIEYYRAISLNYVDLPTHYPYSECYNIMYLARNGIQLNVNTEQGVRLFVSQCSLYFKKLLKDLSV